MTGGIWWEKIGRRQSAVPDPASRRRVRNVVTRRSRSSTTRMTTSGGRRSASSIRAQVNGPRRRRRGWSAARRAGGRCPSFCATASPREARLRAGWFVALQDAGRIRVTGRSSCGGFQFCSHSIEPASQPGGGPSTCSHSCSWSGVISTPPSAAFATRMRPAGSARSAARKSTREASRASENTRQSATVHPRSPRSRELTYC